MIRLRDINFHAILRHVGVVLAARAGLHESLGEMHLRIADLIFRGRSREDAVRQVVANTAIEIIEDFREQIIAMILGSYRTPEEIFPDTEE